MAARATRKAAPAKPARRRRAATVAAVRAASALRILEADTEFRRIETERIEARADGVRCGVLFDHLAHPEPPGTSRVVYHDKATQITLVVAAPLVSHDFEAFCADLENAGVDTRLLRRLAKKHRTECRAAHKFVASKVA